MLFPLFGPMAAGTLLSPRDFKMSKQYGLVILLLCAVFTHVVCAQQAIRNFVPVTQAMLENPPARDWLMFSRTYDAQRYSPLDQIDNKNVANLQMIWSRGIGTSGQVESIPLVHDGIMYVLGPNDVIFALDAETGDLIWKYERELDAALKPTSRSKNLAIYGDMVFHTAADNYIIALDARTGELRWETRVDGGQHTSGPIVVKGIVISGRACGRTRDSCFTAAHDARTGREMWRFYHVPAMGQPGSETWGKSPDHESNMAATWGLPGSYDPKRNLVLWGVANPMPNTRADRHGGDFAGTAFASPADLFSNSTVALEPETGKLEWYYQHLPADDWDQDYTNDRTLVRIRINPDPKYVKWINESARGQERDVSVMIGEGGGIFVNDRDNGEFLWATPFPFDIPEFLISDIDTRTGQTFINRDLIFKKPGEHHLICFWNTRSYWPTSYSPRTNSLYSTYIDHCLDMTSKSEGKREHRTGGLRPEADQDKLNGLARINLETGEITRFNESQRPSTGAMLTTAGGVVFNGDIYRYLRAFDDVTGKKLWETRLGGPITVSTITYAVNGKQYVAVITGDNMATTSLARLRNAPDHITGHFAVYAFGLPGNSPRTAGDSVLRNKQLAQVMQSKPTDMARVAAKSATLTPLTAAPAAAEPGTVVNIDEGENIYFQICQPCHGDDGRGGPGGGAPLTDSLTVDTIKMVLHYGRNTMPAFGTIYSDEEIDNIANYVFKNILAN